MKNNGLFDIGKPTAYAESTKEGGLTPLARSNWP